MNHLTTSRFWLCYQNLPEEIQRLADKNFKLLKEDPQHPSLHFKKVGPFWSVRVGIHYRSLALERPEGLYWFWIGAHDEYDRLIK